MVAFLALPASGCATLDRDDLHTGVGHLRSAAAEGSLLANEAELGRAPTQYVWIHSAELRKQAEHELTKLDRGIIEEGLGPRAAQVEKLAREVSGDLDRLHHLPNEEATAARVREDLDLQVVKATALEQELE